MTVLQTVHRLVFKVYLLAGILLLIAAGYTALTIKLHIQNGSVYAVRGLETANWHNIFSRPPVTIVHLRFTFFVLSFQL